MKFNRTPIALAAITLLASAPFAAQAAVTVYFKTPTAGTTLNNVTWNQSTACEVAGSGIVRAQFVLINSSGVSTNLNNDTSSPFRCNLVSSSYPNGNYILRVFAYDSAGNKAISSRSIVIKNGTVSDAKPTISFTAPANNATVSAVTTCTVSAKDDKGVKQVQFFMDGTLLSTDTTSSYTCSIDNKKYTNGAHTLKAVVTDSANQTATAQITINISGGISSTTSNTPPTVGITSPAAGTTVAGSFAYAATASDTGGSVAKVEMYLTSGTTQKLVDTKTASPYSGTISTAGMPNGGATLMAVATDNLGAKSSVQRSITINNTVVSDPGTGGGTTDPGAGGGSPTTLTGVRAVATFESLGLYWTPGSNPGADGCQVRYRKTTDSAWKEGFPMWYDSRDGECRSSIVHLEPGVDYAVEVGVNGSFTAGVNAKTWADSFPVGQTIQVQNSSQTLKITQGGTKDAYLLYTGPATIDVANGAAYNVEISAKYVIVRGLTLKGATSDGIRLLPGASDVVIEGNDISNWGSYSGTTLGGVQVGKERQSAVRADCRDGGGFTLERTVIQRNKLHHPRYGANSWDYGHPLGPQGIGYSFCGGNHVFRYNEVYSADGHYFKDGLGGEANFSDTGFPNADSDIYGNIIQHTWDDGIEAEGGNKNVRIWGNYIDQTAIGIATTVVHYGPAYIFRNVYNRSRKLSAVSLDQDQRLNFAKSGTESTFGGGRRYVFHNTMLQATQSGLQYPLGAGGGIIAAGTTSPLTNTMSRNNILQVWKAGNDSIRTQGGGGNDFNYDLRNGGISAYAGAEANGIVGTPIYKSGNGWSSWAGGNYQLDASSPGYDQGQRLPNFNDAFTGAAPDMGAHEAGTAAMRLGVNASGVTWIAPDSGTTSTATATSTTGSTSTTADSGVCATAACVVTQ
jgi:Big-like domain-containing protein